MTLALLSIPFHHLPLWALIAIIIVGLAALTFGGDWLTDGAVAISANLKINPIVIGLTVVSIATSMPEMATSLMAAKDNPGIALGNILGSNIANIALILGFAAVISPLKIKMRMIRREVPILILVTMLFACFALGGGFYRYEGIILIFLTLGYLVYLVSGAKVQDSEVADEFAEGAGQIQHRTNLSALFLIVLGAGALAVGADFLVGSSVEIATRMGVSDLFIGLTIVAIGTSLPELAASIAAVRAGHGDMCAGNIVGSNLFNMLLIGGGVATLTGMDVRNELLIVEFPALVILSVLLLFIFKSGHIVSRREGVFLLFLYLAILSVSGMSQLGYLF
jgi:cation:H+ antiporter